MNKLFTRKENKTTPCWIANVKPVGVCQTKERMRPKRGLKKVVGLCFQGAAQRAVFKVLCSYKAARFTENRKHEHFVKAH